MHEDRTEKLDPIERLLTRWHGIELWLGLLLMVGGLVAVGVGWYQAAGTGDVRIQLQALISGGLGGVAAVLAGGFLVQAHLTASGLLRLSRQFDRVTDALLQLADEAHGRPAGSAATGWAPDQDTAALPVLASHASYHLPGCDLARERSDLTSMSLVEARAQNLEPCRACAVGALA